MRYKEINSQNSTRYVVRQVQLWTAEGVTPNVDVWVKDGIVVKITGYNETQSPSMTKPDSTDWLTIDGGGHVLIPAGVDAQVHLRVPGQDHKETATTGLWACVVGGVGAILNMPNTKPVLDQVEVLVQAKKLVLGPEDETGVKVLFSAAMTMGQKGKECVDFEGLAQAGVTAFTDDGVGVADDEVMLNVLKGAAKTGLPVLQHAEVHGHGAVLADGPIQKAIGSDPYPESAEVDMVRRDLKLLEQVPTARYHVLHVSAGRTIGLVQEAKKKGLHVSCEVSPHHLFFTADDVMMSNSSFKMNPPLRSVADRRILRSALAAGLCDFMATDHAPHEADVKTSNFKTSAFGTTGVETSLRLLIKMWQQGELSPQRLVEVWAQKPAKFLGIQSTHGTIAVGRPFQGVVVDVNHPDCLVREQDFVGLSHNSCFIGSSLPGRIRATMLGSKIHDLSPLYEVR